jgi:hypothetical protein
MQKGGPGLPDYSGDNEENPNLAPKKPLPKALRLFALVVL